MSFDFSRHFNIIQVYILAGNSRASSIADNMKRLYMHTIDWTSTGKIHLSNCSKKKTKTQHKTTMQYISIRM